MCGSLEDGINNLLREVFRAFLSRGRVVKPVGNVESCTQVQS